MDNSVCKLRAHMGGLSLELLARPEVNNTLCAMLYKWELGRGYSSAVPSRGKGLGNGELKFVNCAMGPDCKHVCSAIGPTQLNERGRQLMELQWRLDAWGHWERRGCAQLIAPALSVLKYRVEGQISFKCKQEVFMLDSLRGGRQTSALWSV